MVSNTYLWSSSQIDAAPNFGTCCTILVSFSGPLVEPRLSRVLHSPRLMPIKACVLLRASCLLCYARTSLPSSLPPFAPACLPRHGQKTLPQTSCWLEPKQTVKE